MKEYDTSQNTLHLCLSEDESDIISTYNKYFLAYFASVLCSTDSAVAYSFVPEIARQVSNSTSSSLSMYIYCRFQKANGNFASKL